MQPRRHSQRFILGHNRVKRLEQRRLIRAGRGPAVGRALGSGHGRTVVTVDAGERAEPVKGGGLGGEGVGQELAKEVAGVGSEPGVQGLGSDAEEGASSVVVLNRVGKLAASFAAGMLIGELRVSR